MTEKAVKLEAKYQKVETELQNALEASQVSKIDHAETMIAERKVRLQAIDSLREQLNALTQVSTMPSNALVERLEHGRKHWTLSRNILRQVVGMHLLHLYRHSASGVQSAVVVTVRTSWQWEPSL